MSVATLRNPVEGFGKAVAASSQDLDTSLRQSVARPADGSESTVPSSSSDSWQRAGYRFGCFLARATGGTVAPPCQKSLVVEPEAATTTERIFTTEPTVVLTTASQPAAPNARPTQTAPLRIASNDIDSARLIQQRSTTRNHRMTAARRLVAGMFDGIRSQPFFHLGLRRFLGGHATELVLAGAGIASLLLTGNLSVLTTLSAETFDILSPIAQIGLGLIVGPLWAEFVITGIGIAVYLFFRHRRATPASAPAY